MESGVRLARSTLFQELKIPCVELSQLALRDDGSPASTRLLVQATTKLLALLEQKCQTADGVFDQKLADYAFFPISQILRRKKQHTDQLSELTLKCLRILLEYGWRTLDLDLGKQLLILLTFIAGGVPATNSPVASEEVKSSAFTGLAFLYRDLALTPGGAQSLVESATLPALGHSVTVILESATVGPSPEVQIQALGALDAVWKCLKDREALASFLPGTISGLTKCLTPSTSNRRTQKALISGLKVLQSVLVVALGDIQTRTIRLQATSASETSLKSSDQKTLTPSWLKATTGQIKLALSNVIRLRKNQSADVKSTLYQLCLRLLDECHETLQDSAALLVETALILSDTSSTGFNERNTTLMDLATIFPDILEHVKSSVYNWVTSLPRVMQANDEARKAAALDQLSKAHSVFLSLRVESSILEDSLAAALRDSITVTLENSLSSKIIEEAAFGMDTQAALSLVSDNRTVTNFRPILLDNQSQIQTLHSFQNLLLDVASRDSGIVLARNMLESARGGTGNNLLSSFWLAANILSRAAKFDVYLDEFLDTSHAYSDELSELTEELLSYSVSILTEQDDPSKDWRMQAISLEVVAYTAQQRKEDFRVDLVDVLYPIAELLGSSQAALREHAMTCLNVISNACGYQSVSTLIVQNADYMVNALSLRLNTFDITPSAPQVLVMMIRLSGPSLLLYLDDVVSSIFAALDNFHGYARLVESLFSVLSEVVSVGARSDQLTIEDAKPVIHLESCPQPAGINDILALIYSQPTATTTDVDGESERFPRTPWKSAKTLLDERDALLETDEDGESQREIEQASNEVIIPPTKTHTVLHHITNQTQHHLTSSSPTLRTKLLGLIQTSISSLPQSSPDFLPLINDIWPVVLSRLYDKEPYVQIAAAETLCTLCRASGDFLSTRIKTEWTTLISLVRKTKQAVDKEKRGAGGRGDFAMTRKVWDAILRLLGDVVGHVGVSDKMFDDVLEVVGREELRKRKGLRELLESGKGNADAVWLELDLYDRQDERVQIRPHLEGYEFVTVAI